MYPAVSGRRFKRYVWVLWTHPRMGVEVGVGLLGYLPGRLIVIVPSSAIFVNGFFD
jgi:hypothetical protein